MESSNIEILSPASLKAIHGGGKIAQLAGKIAHYLVDSFYKASEVDNRYNFNHP